MEEIWIPGNKEAVPLTKKLCHYSAGLTPNFFIGELNVKRIVCICSYWQSGMGILLPRVYFIIAIYKYDRGQGKAKGPGFDAWQLHLSLEPFPSHLKGQQTIMARLRSLIGPSQIRTQTILIGVPTIGLPAVITFKIQLNNITFTCTQVSQIHLSL